MWKTALWRQLGAAIDMLGNAVTACPEELWSDRSRQPEFWYLVYHTLFFLDLYLHGTAEGFAPPAPFTLAELDPAGVLPDRVYTQGEMLAYLRHCRAKGRETILALTDEQARRLHRFDWLEMEGLELHLVSLRHVQHHTAQLNLLLRQRTDSAPRWVRKGDLSDDPDFAFMTAALEQAEKSYGEGGLPIGAVLVADGKIVARGHNKRVQEGDPIAHGEMDCLRNAGRRRRYDDVTLYTTLSPCMMCSGAVLQLGIPRVVVGESASFPGNLEFLRGHGVEVRLLADERCVELMQRFIREKPELWDEDIAGRERV